MKEILTKKFWRDVKKTFDEAREEPPNVADSRAGSPAEGSPKDGQAGKDPVSERASLDSDQISKDEPT
jgi:hypothetical protein